MAVHSVSSCGDILDAVYDEFGACYGCKLRGEDGPGSFLACAECTWAACPMRGGKKEAR